MSLLTYPYLLLVFWYVEAPLKLLRFFVYFNTYIFHLLSIPLFFHTFFKPAKLEYRKGMVGISILLGIMAKSVLLFVDVFIFIPILIFEIAFFIAFLAYPVLPIYVLIR